MATNKKSFVLYADLLGSVEHLTNEELGELFRHILEYVNDEAPVLENRLLFTAWKPIERSLKDDLKKWEDKRQKRSEAGRKGGLAKASNAKQSVANLAVTVSDTVTVTENVINIKGFLLWFNEQKERHTGTKGKFKTLSTTDKTNLKQLRKSYGTEDFVKAIGKMLDSKWAKETGNQTPAHFLRVDNFNRYLNQSEETKPNHSPYG